MHILFPLTEIFPIFSASTFNNSTFFFVLSALALRRPSSLTLREVTLVFPFFLFLFFLSEVLLFSSDIFSIPKIYRLPRVTATLCDNFPVGPFYWMALKWNELLARYYEAKLRKIEAEEKNGT